MSETAASCALCDMARFWHLRSATQMRAGNGGNGSRPFEVLPGVCLTVWNVPPGVRYSLDYARKDRSCTVSFFRTGSEVLDMADGQTTHLGPGDVLVAPAKNIVFAVQAPAQCHGVTIGLDPVRIEGSVRQDAVGLDLSRLAGFAAGCRVPLVMHADAVLSHVCFDLEALQANGERGTLLYLKSMEVLVDCPHLSIGQIAAEIGYSSPSKFSKAFANRYGVTPRAWRFAHTKPSEN